jgi:hypothetical protein
MLVLLWTPVVMFRLSGAPMIRDDLHLVTRSRLAFIQRPDKTQLTYLRSYWRSDDCRAVVVTTFPAADRP